MNRAISKKLMAIVAIVALVAILGVCLVACNKDDYVKRLDKAGYTAKAISAEDAHLDAEELGIEWIVQGIKVKGGAESVTVIKFNKSEDAKDFYNDNKDNVLDGWKIVRSGKIVISGTEQGVKDAQ